MKHLLSTIGLLLLTSVAVQAVRHEPLNRSRVYWDLTTRRVPISGPSIYGRLIELQDGRLLMMGASWVRGIEMTYSSDHGATWTKPRVILSQSNMMEYCNPEFMQLADGTILLATNRFPVEPYTEDRRYEVNVMRSTDNGETWSPMTRIYTGTYTPGDGSWEPDFLLLPSGELHCYFSLELENSNDQQIMLSRSFDYGYTWSTPQRVSYRQGHRDGMPVAILTDNNEIVYSIEDNGQPGYEGFRATTIRCSLEDNWSSWVDADSPQRSLMHSRPSDLAHLSAGPYIRKMPGGETLMSWMGECEGVDGKGIDFYHFFVAVGDADARDFRCANEAFYVPEGEQATWGSVSIDSHGYVYALASTGPADHSEGNAVMRGRARKGFTASYGTPVVDGNPTRDVWPYDEGGQLTMGTRTGNRFEMDFLYDDQNLYFYAYAVDPEILLDEKIDKDGIFLWLDVVNACDTYPQKGMFKFFFGADGTISMRRGEGNRWQAEELDPEGVVCEKRVGKRYYILEGAIPWSVLGESGAPSPDRIMRINVQQRDRRSRKLLYETIPEAADRSSWTWPELRLGENTGIPGCEMPDTEPLTIAVSGRNVSAEGSRIEVFSPSGALIASGTGSVALPAAGIYVVKAVGPSGRTAQRKVAVN